MSDSGGCYRFARFEVDGDILQLRRDGLPLRVEPRALDLLLYLIERRERVVGKAELLDAVWGGVLVTDGALTRAVTKLRRVLGDKARSPRYIETLHGKGYRFCAAIEWVSAASSTSGAALEVTQDVLPIGVGAHNIASPTRDFTGRALEIEALLAMIDTGTGTLIAGLRGMGGMGKSELARKVAQERWDAYPDAHLEIDLAGASPEPLSSASAMAQILRDLNPQIELPNDPAALRRSYWSSLKGQRGILLLDNACSADQVEPLLPPDGWLTLVTSRFRFTVPGFEALDLGSLCSEEARAFLAKLAPRTIAVADDLLRLTGRLPLALRLAGSALATHTDLPPDVFVRRLNKAGGLADGVAASLSVSFGLLAEPQQASWTELAVFPGSFTPAAAAAVWNVEEEIAHCALSDFFTASMVEWSDGRYRLHDLARTFALDRVEEPHRARLRHARYYLKALARLDALYLQGGEHVHEALVGFDRDYRNIVAAQDWLSQSALGRPARELLVRFPTVGRHLLRLRQHPLQAIGWAREALRSAEALGLERAQGDLHCSLGDAFFFLGDMWRALEHYEQFLALSRKAGDAEREGNALGNMGNAHLSSGRADLAIRFYEQRLAIALSIGDRRGQACAMQGLGAAAVNDDPPRAIELLHRGLALFRGIGDHLSEGTTIANLASAHLCIGDAQHALLLLEQSRAIDLALGDHSRTAMKSLTLSRACADLGHHDRGDALCEEALARARQVGDRRAEAEALRMRGVGATRRGELRQAVECFQRAILIAREIEDRSAKGRMLRDLGVAYAALEEEQWAVQVLESALSIAQEFCDVRGEALAAWHLSFLVETRGDVGRAVDLASLLATYFRRINHPAAEDCAARVQALVAKHGRGVKGLAPC